MHGDDAVLTELLTDAENDELLTTIIIDIVDDYHKAPVLQNWDNVRKKLVAEMRKPAIKTAHRVHFLKR
jgi:hypothetical protein